MNPRSAIAEYVAGVVDGLELDETTDVRFTIQEGQVTTRVEGTRAFAGHDALSLRAEHTAWQGYTYERGREVGEALREAL